MILSHHDHQFELAIDQAPPRIFHKWVLFDAVFEQKQKRLAGGIRRKSSTYWQARTRHFLSWNQSCLLAIAHGFAIHSPVYEQKILPAHFQFSTAQLVRDNDTRNRDPNHPRAVIKRSNHHADQAEQFGPAFAYQTEFSMMANGFMQIEQQWLIRAREIIKDKASHNDAPHIIAHYHRDSFNIQLWADDIKVAMHQDGSMMVTDWSARITYPDAKMVFHDDDITASHIYEGLPIFTLSLSFLNQNETILKAVEKAKNIEVIIKATASQSQWVALKLSGGFVSSVRPSAPRDNGLAETMMTVTAAPPKGYLQVIHGNQNDK